MKIVKIIGGLGNQMFQYALYLSFCERGYDAKIDITAFDNYDLHNGFELEQIFDIDPVKASKKEIELYSRVYHTKIRILGKLKRLLPLKKTEYREKVFVYDKNIFQHNNKVYYLGYWIDERYFFNIRDRISKVFTFSSQISNINKKLIEKIYSSNSVSIHFRRGDYFKNNTNKKLYGNICPKEYYIKAIALMKKKLNNPLFVVFSDDIEWVKENFLFSFGPNNIIVDWNKGKDSYIDMQLMSLCKNNIIANSTFSWWGAWLNNNDDKIVIAPDKWINLDYVDDVIPNSWIKIGKTND